MGIEVGDLFFKTLRLTDVIAIHANQKFAACQIDAIVAGGDNAAIMPRMKFASGVLLYIPPN